MKTVSAWLLESSIGKAPIYWSATQACGRNWTTDAWGAIHFSDERSAERVMAFLKPASVGWRVVEHGFDVEETVSDHPDH